LSNARVIAITGHVDVALWPSYGSAGFERRVSAGRSPDPIPGSGHCRRSLILLSWWSHSHSHHNRHHEPKEAVFQSDCGVQSVCGRTSGSVGVWP
jgi:hypothetical protein